MFDAKNYFRVVVRLMESKEQSTFHDESYTLGIVKYAFYKSVPYERKGD